MNDDIVKRIRNFNRYYTAWLEVMNKEYLKTGFSWTESRVIFEIHICPGINATELCEHLNTDKSYISRILMKFEKDGLLTRELILGSKGLKKIWLTEAGEKQAESKRDKRWQIRYTLFLIFTGTGNGILRQKSQKSCW